MSLFSFMVHANETVRDVDVRSLTDMQIYCKAFDLIYFQKYQEAIDFCEEILKHKPHNPEAHFEKGLALSYLNKWEEAVDSYDLSIRYKRQPLGEVYYYKGIALELLDKLEEALRAYDLAIENNFDYRDIYYRQDGVERKILKNSSEVK